MNEAERETTAAAATTTNQQLAASRATAVSGRRPAPTADCEHVCERSRGSNEMDSLN
jgi:hypothetical protein